MSEFYVVVASGQVNSSPFALERPDASLVVHVPSLAADNEVRPQFGSTSGGPFSTLTRPDGTGAAYAVHSGAGPALGVIERPPFPWGRFSFTGSPGDVRTLTVFPTRR